MAEANPNPTPTASTQQPDLSAQLAALTGVVTTMAQSQAALLQALGQQQAHSTPQAGSGQAGSGKGQAPSTSSGQAQALTLEDLNRVLNERDTRSQQTAARQQYAATKLKDLPPGYEQRLGSDPAKWPAEEQQLRTEFRAFLGTQGVKPPDVGGGNAGGTAAGSVVDLSKQSTMALIEQGLAQAKTAGGGNVTAPTRTQPGAAQQQTEAAAK